MPSLRRPSNHALRALAAAILASAAGAILVAAIPAAHAASSGQLQQQISAGQGRRSSLSGAVSAASGRISQLESTLVPLEARLARIQANLNAYRAQLLRLQSELQAARTRLAQLEAFQARAESALSKQLVNSYESDRPDIVSVVLESHGFRDLLERLAFAQRIRKQDVAIVSQVRSARKSTAAQATRLGGLEASQQRLTAQVLQQRNELASVRLKLVQQQAAASQ